MGVKLNTLDLKRLDIRPSQGVFFKKGQGYLCLSDGGKFAGSIPAGQLGEYTGEVVFNTGMTGYVESLTDPSYAGQILLFTYPLIGNYGVNPDWGESEKIQVSGVVVSEACLYPSHSGSEYTLIEWLQAQSIPIILDIDTRALTKHLREKGTMAGIIAPKPASAKNIELKTQFVSVNKPKVYNPKGRKSVILVDCGVKANIIRSLLELNLRVKRVPADYDYTSEEFDGVVLSNGPGDPSDYVKTVGIAKRAMAKGKPVFGICLGSQIMGLSAGAKTYKLKFGHRGHNQPCVESSTERAYITSQNHGYAIDEKSLPTNWRVSFRNLNDGSVEGIEHKSKPFFSVQFHPEACPGPTDTKWLFERFNSSL